MKDEQFLTELRKTNGERAEAWAEGRPSDPLFWAIELGGEVGEILNVVKKLRREEIGWRGSRATLDDLSDEIADGLICLDSLARHYGIDLAEATARKFNKTSEKVGLPHRIEASNNLSHHKNPKTGAYCFGLITRSATPAPQADALREAVQKAAEWFDEYAVGHADKKTPEGDSKAARNRERAEWLRAHLTGSQTDED